MAGLAVAVLTCGAAFFCRGDQVDMQNGDRYLGKIVSLDGNEVVFQSEMLGKVRFPRAKISQLTLGTNTASRLSATNRSGVLLGATAVPNVTTNSIPELSKILRQYTGDTNLMQQIEGQLQGSAGGEARAKFNEMMGGVLTGRLSVSDIRKEAQLAATQLRALKRELGDDTGWGLDGYLSILDNFVKETAPANTQIGGPSSARP